jgi:hypothetical protein
MNVLGVSSCAHFAHITCYWNFFCTTHKSSVSTGFTEQIMFILCILTQLLLVTQPRHGPHRKHCFQQFYCCMRLLRPLSGYGRRLQSHYPARGLNATILWTISGIFKGNSDYMRFWAYAQSLECNLRVRWDSTERLFHMPCILKKSKGQKTAHVTYAVIFVIGVSI